MDSSVPDRLRAYQRFITVAAGWITAKRAKTYAALVPLVALAVLAIDSIVKGSFWFVYKGDFILFYTGGRYFLDGRLNNLYDFAAQQAFQSNTLRLGVPQFTPFNHPPFTTLFYAPFAIAGFEWGLLLWTATGLISVFLAWHMLHRELSGLSDYSPLRLSLLSFCFYPTIAWLLANQNSAFTFFIYTATYIQLRRRRDLSAGAVLGCLLYKPQLALTPAFILLIKGRFRALAGFFLTSSLLLGLGFLLSPEAMLQYIRVMPQIAELPFLPGYPIEKMHNFYGFAVLLLAHLTSLRVIETAALLLAVGGLLVVAAWWRTTPWQPGMRQWDLTFAFTLALGLLISPHLIIYDLMVLLLPLAIVCAVYPKRPQYLLDGGPLLVWTALLWVAVFVSTDAASAMLQATAAMGIPKLAVQVSVPIICAWACVGFAAAKSCGQEKGPSLVTETR